MASLKQTALPLIALLLAAGGVTRAQGLPEPLQALFQEAVQAQKAGRLEAAEKAFLSLLEKGGKAAFVYNNLGIVYQQSGQPLRAIAQFREAIRLDPGYVAPRILLGASLVETGSIAEAARELERAIELDPSESRTRLLLVKAYQRQGNIPGVIEQYRALREAAPQEPEYAYQLGRAYLKESSWCLERILKLDRGSARLYQILGDNYLAQGRLDLAARSFDQAARANPALPEVHLALADIYQRQGKSAEARKEVERELAIVPESAAALALRQKLDALQPQH